MNVSKVPANVLSPAHHRMLRDAITRILDTSVAREAYAQILDGAPTLFNSHSTVGKHNRHAETGDEAYQVYDAFRTTFSLDILSFAPPVFLLQLSCLVYS